MEKYCQYTYFHLRDICKNGKKIQMFAGYCQERAKRAGAMEQEMFHFVLLIFIDNFGYLQHTLSQMWTSIYMYAQLNTYTQTHIYTQTHTRTNTHSHAHT